MAKAKASKRIVEKQVVVKEEVIDNVTLDLTSEEASTLIYLVGRVCGPSSGDDAPRKHTDNIYHALLSAGVVVRNDVEVARGDALWFAKRSGSTK